MKFLSLGLLILLGVASVPVVPAQNADTGEAKARQVMKAAIEAMGGELYLQVKNSYSYGRYFMFGKEGQKGFTRYWDWTVYDPVKSRNQMGEGKRQEVHIYNFELRKAWKLEGKDTVQEITEEEIKDFEKAIKHNIDILLRKRVDEEGLHLYYYGSEEIAGTGDYEAVEFLDSSNDSVVIYFDRNTRLPARLEYQITDKFGIRHKQEEEFLNWHKIQGVHTPLRLDTYTDGKISFQNFLEGISYDVNIPPEYFLEPKIEKKK